VPVGNRAPRAKVGRTGRRRGTWLLIFIDIDILIQNDSSSYRKAEAGQGAGWKPGTNGGGGTDWAAARNLAFDFH